MSGPSSPEDGMFEDVFGRPGTPRLDVEVGGNRDDLHFGVRPGGAGNSSVSTAHDVHVNSTDDSSESDPEDPLYLRELCAGFSRKLKEKNDAIKIYKKALLTSQLQLVKREAVFQKKLRRMIWKERRKAMAQGNGVVAVQGQGFEEMGRDPLLIFPEEIWLMIFGNVKETKDLRSCSKANPLFERVLDETKAKWLFGKIFPFVYHKLRRKDILKCRLVCSEWAYGIDTFLEHFYTIISPDKQNLLLSENIEDEELHVPLKSFHFEYNFSIPPPAPENLEDSSSSDSDESITSSMESINRSHDKIREKLKLHHKNPFLGRSVTIEEDSTDFEQLEAQRGGRTFVSEAKRFLEDFGENIWHLSICCNMDTQTPSQYYQTCLESLIHCKGLRSLCLAADLNWRVRRSAEITRIIEAPPPVDRPSLDSLQVDVDNQKIFVIQNKLLEKYSNQLRRLEVQLWNPELYFHFPWGVLRELQINKGSAEETLNSLRKAKCPSLRTLILRLESRGPYLQKILEISNRFPKLNHLDLKFESRFGGIDEDELLSVPPGLCSSAELTTLEITSSVTDMQSFNFLIYFPYLQRLQIRHGHWTNYNLRDAAAPYLSHLQYRSNRNSSNVMDIYGGSVHRKTEIIKIAKYIFKNGMEPEVKLMYRSNVWRHLPFLQEFTVSNARYVPEKKRVYTRMGYEYYHQNEGEGQDRE